MERRRENRVDRDVLPLLDYSSPFSPFPIYRSPFLHPGSYPILLAIVYNSMVSCAATPAINSFLSLLVSLIVPPPFLPLPPL